MSEFKILGDATNAAFKSMLEKDTSKRNMFVVCASGDELWDHYIASFPEGSNPIFREKTEHECSCCRNFVKNIGGVVYTDGVKVQSVWDAQVNDPVYGVVAEEMSKFVKSRAIKGPFYVTESKYGAKQTNTNGEIWNHFYADVPKGYLMKNNDSNVVGMRRDDFSILCRTLTEITDDSVDTVSDLIAQNSLYRGDEHKGAIATLKSLKAQFKKIKSAEQKELFLWTTATPATRIKNTVIGTLLVDLSEGVDLDRAVASFESKVAPTNYKRPKALVTQKMIDSAKKTVDNLGIEDSLSRRYATKSDISVNNVLFVNGTARQTMIGGAFDGIKPTKTVVREYKTVDAISIDNFIANVLPNVDEVEMFVKSTHTNHFVSLIAPEHAESKPLFKWDNGFSWSYDGEVTDSIKERVKQAGGKVDGDVRISLSWHNGDDLDLHLRNLKRQEVYFGQRRNFGAFLDVDMNAGCASNSTDPVENIVWSRMSEMPAGTYEIIVHNFNKRSMKNEGFEVEVEILGKLYSFSHPGAIGSRAYVEAGTITKDKDGTISVRGMVSGGSSSEKWGIKTEDWAPVEMIMRSPNFWDDKKIGNQHVFFMLQNCVNPEDTRGFYNEFLRDDLIEHKKVFEMLASKLKVSYNASQLSGIGISTTQKEDVLVRVKGSINRVLKVTF